MKRYIRGDGGQVETENGVLLEVLRKNKEDFIKRAGLIGF